MRNKERTDTDHHRDMESVWRASISNSPGAGHRPADGEAVGEPWETTVGLRSVEGSRSPVHGAQASQVAAGWRGCPSSAQVAGKDGLLQGEAGGDGPSRGDRGVGVYHTPVSASKGLIRSSTKRRRPRYQNGKVMRPSKCPGLGYLQMDVKYVTPELSGLPYTCYLYAALDIYTRYKVGLILPKVDEAGALLALYHATEELPFPVRYVQTDNGLEFQKRFHAK